MKNEIFNNIDKSATKFDHMLSIILTYQTAYTKYIQLFCTN